MKRNSVRIAIVTIVLVVAGSLAHAAEGNREGVLDHSFDSDGIVVTPFSRGQTKYLGRAQGVAVAENGQIVIAGYVYDFNGQPTPSTTSDFIVTRYNNDGSRDPEFAGGFETTDFANNDDGAMDVAVQQDGKIVAVGSAYMDATKQDDFALVRYLTTGGEDPTFGSQSAPNAGEVTTHIGTNDVANAVAIQGDGRIVVAGASNSDFALLRYKPDGALDDSFDGDGIVLTDFGVNDMAYDMAIQDDGKIVVIGDSGTFIVVARYLSTGALDPSFADGLGYIRTEDLDSVQSVAIQGDGKIVVAGTLGLNGAVARYTPDGVLDTSFDGNSAGDGIVPVSVSDGTDYILGVAIQDDGKIVAGGVGDYGVADDFAVVRLLEDGSRDDSFGVSGQTLTDIGNSAKVFNIAIQRSGTVVLVGDVVTHGQDFVDQDIALARYVGDAVSPTVSIARTGSGVLSAGQTETITFALSEKSIDFVVGDVTVVNGTLSSFAGSGAQYTAVLTPTAQTRGTISITIASGAFTDKASNGNLWTRSLVIEFDTTTAAESGQSGSGSTIGGGTTPSQTATPPKLRVKKTVTLRAVAKYLGLDMPRGARISAKVKAASKRFCIASGTKKIRGVKMGKCKVAVTVRMTNGTKSTRTATLKVVRR